jgi:hypothetical protein
MKTHPLNVSYLVIGLAFLGIAGSWALHEASVIGSAEVEWLLPLTLVIAGGTGLVAFAARGLRGSRTEEPQDLTAPPPTSGLGHDTGRRDDDDLDSKGDPR